MIYLLDKNGKEFAMSLTACNELSNSLAYIILVDENGVFFSPSSDGVERVYIKTIKRKGTLNEYPIVGFDYKCKHYRLIDAGVAKEDVARRLF